MNAPLDRLRPTLRTSAALAPTDGPDRILRRPAGMLLVEAIRINDAYAPRLVERSDVAEWGMEPEELFATARRNQSQDPRAFLMENTEFSSPVVRNVQPEHNAVEWALNPDFLRGMMPPSPSGSGPDGPFVFLPGPVSMLIARESNLPEIESASAVTARIYESADDRISPCIFTYDDAGMLQPWTATTAARRAKARYVVDVYTAVRDAFGATAETRRFVRGKGWSMPDLLLLDDETPAVKIRQATWQPAKTTLIPTYASVRFLPNKAEPVTATLADLATHAPELIAGVMLDPAWAVLASFPTAEQLAKLRG